MTARLLDGKMMSAEIREQIAAKTRDLKARGITPGLAVKSMCGTSKRAAMKWAFSAGPFIWTKPRPRRHWRMKLMR